jgi:hypothetical protein
MVADATMLQISIIAAHVLTCLASVYSRFRGIPDGMGGYRFGNTVRIFVNHELSTNSGTPYSKLEM